jgi:hypothetical protein
MTPQQWLLPHAAHLQQKEARQLRNNKGIRLADKPLTVRIKPVDATN